MGFQELTIVPILSDSSPVKIGGFAITTIPIVVKIAANIDTYPNFSFNKRYAKIVTKTGVEKEITVTSPMAMYVKA